MPRLQLVDLGGFWAPQGRFPQDQNHRANAVANQGKSRLLQRFNSQRTFQMILMMICQQLSKKINWKKNHLIFYRILWYSTLALWLKGKQIKYSSLWIPIDVALGWTGLIVLKVHCYWNIDRSKIIRGSLSCLPYLIMTCLALFIVLLNRRWGTSSTNSTPSSWEQGTMDLLQQIILQKPTKKF